MFKIGDSFKLLNFLSNIIFNFINIFMWYIRKVREGFRREVIELLFLEVYI